MIVCEYEFVLEDKNHLGYSMTELDFYAWIPTKFHKEHGNHRLTMWKNLKTNKYELVKIYMNQTTQSFQMGKLIGVMTTNLPNKKEEIIFANESLEVVLQEAHGLWNKFHGSDDYQRECDQVCNHVNLIGTFCMKRHIEEMNKNVMRSENKS